MLYYRLKNDEVQLKILLTLDKYFSFNSDKYVFLHVVESLPIVICFNTKDHPKSKI